MKQGAVIDYTIKLFKIPIHWRTLITSYDPPFMFVDEQIKGPYTFWHHTHIFKEIDEGVEIEDKVIYAIPFGIIGRALHFLWIRKDLKNIFEYRKKIIEKFFTKENQEVPFPSLDKASAE
jgi:ligand-binding SRPBCC domain-containing protein